jgi:hypothetical protein
VYRHHEGASEGCGSEGGQSVWWADRYALMTRYPTSSGLHSKRAAKPANTPSTLSISQYQAQCILGIQRAVSPSHTNLPTSSHNVNHTRTIVSSLAHTTTSPATQAHLPPQSLPKNHTIPTRPYSTQRSTCLPPEPPQHASPSPALLLPLLPQHAVYLFCLATTLTYILAAPRTAWLCRRGEGPWGREAAWTRETWCRVCVDEVGRGDGRRDGAVW